MLHRTVSASPPSSPLLLFDLIFGTMEVSGSLHITADGCALLTLRPTAQHQTVDEIAVVPAMPPQHPQSGPPTTEDVRAKIEAKGWVVHASRFPLSCQRSAVSGQRSAVGGNQTGGSVHERLGKSTKKCWTVWKPVEQLRKASKRLEEREKLEQLTKVLKNVEKLARGTCPF